MTKIDIISGFLGAGKTTLIKKLLKEALSGEKVVLIENEFGEIGIDGGFLKEAGIQITEMNSGCICCSLVGDFRTALNQILDQYHPDRIVIEPTGVGKLSDVIKAVMAVATERDDAQMNAYATVADANKCKMYHNNFGEFYNDQIAAAGTVLLSRSANITQEKLETANAIIREINPNCAIVTTDWDALDGKTILEVMEKNKFLLEISLDDDDDDDDECCCHHHHDDDDDDDECCCHHHHDDDDEDEHEHHHHHHYDENGVCECGHHHDDDDDDDDEHEHHHHHHHDDDDDDEDEHEHHHHHHHDDDDDDDEDEECCCHHHHDDDDDEDEHEHHHHHHHHHHHADEVFTSWEMETPAKFTKADLERILTALSADDSRGMILRSKGIVPSADVAGEWYHFDMVPGEYEIRTGSADYTGRICVIGSKLKEEEIKALFMK